MHNNKTAITKSQLYTHVNMALKKRLLFHNEHNESKASKAAWLLEG